jgi:hypothetical protein
MKIRFDVALLFLRRFLLVCDNFTRKAVQTDDAASVHRSEQTATDE